MKVNFYIHGVPKGQDVWGSEQDRDYIKSFYSVSCAESVRFVAEIIPAKKRAFYTYLRAKNVYGSENREGSYFGMTVSFDGVYCTDNESLYALFDTVFNKRILGSILQNNNGNYRFLSPTFDAKGKELESLQSEFIKQLGSFSEDFEEIDTSFKGTANGQVAYFHTSDIDNSSFFSVLKQTLKVYISPEYPTKDAQIASLRKQVDPEKAKNKQLSEDKAELESNLAAAVEKGKRNESEIASLRSEKQKLEEENKGLRSENASLKSELERNKAKNSIERSVNQIRQPLEDLLKGVRKLTPASIYDEPHHYHHEHHESRESRFHNLWSVLMNVIIIVMFLLLIGLCCLMVHHVSESTPIFSKEVAKEVKAAPVKATTPPAIQIVGVRDGEPLAQNTEYAVRLLNAPQGKQIKWKLDGAETSSSRTEVLIRVKPSADKDTAIISCYIVDNANENLIDRKICQIKKQ